MKKFISFALIAAMAVTTLVGCGNKGAKADGGSSDAAITVMSREDGSGTRGAFIELFGIEEEENGEKVDKTTDEASITNSTSVMMSSVANDANAIGYISLGSLNDTVKAVKIDGAEASVDNVKNGSYKVVRPFNIVLGKKTSDAANDFVNYIMSADGQKIIEDNGYIPVDEGAAAYQASNAKGKVVVGDRKLGNVTLKFQAQNLFVIADKRLKGYDPETINYTTTSYGSLPLATTFTLGLNINF